MSIIRLEMISMGCINYDLSMLYLRLELAVLLLDLDDMLDLLLVVLVAQQPTVLGGQLLGLALGNLGAGSDICEGN